MPNADITANNFCEKFFAKSLRLADLKIIHDQLQKSSISFAGNTIPASIYLKGTQKTGRPPFVILAQLHGNEPAGLAGIALCMALFEAGLLKHDVIGIIGNPLAAGQYFSAWEKNPDAPQETRDAFRCGLGENGELLPDGNRIPVDFMQRDTGSPHIRRAQELWKMAQNISGILDIHSARGNMTCITDHKNDNDLKYSPIRAILTELAEAISAHASATVTVQTLKTILSPLPNIKCQTGIEAGRHEDPAAPYIAASFTLSTIYNQGITDVKPVLKEDDGIFERYSVQPRITYSDLAHENNLQAGDYIHMAREHNGRIEDYQYDEMQAISKGQVVAVARPSGTVFRAREDFSGIFFSKPAALYDKDPAVGPWPVAADKINSVKFCYPCLVSEMKIIFS
jgi:hypothetical protein